MARVPGVPDISPVDISPRTAGRGGQAIAEMGEEIEGLGLEGMGLETRIREAQKQVDRLAASNQLDAAFTSLQDDLSKTTNSRDIPDLLKHHQDGLNSITQDWQKSPDYQQIQMMAQSLQPGMAHHAQVRQVDLMGKEWEAQKDLQVEKLLPQYVAAERNGDRDGAAAIQQHLSDNYDEAIRNGLKTPADKALNMDAFRKATQKDLIEASITSANAGERTAAIAQLTKGGSGPLDLTGLSPGAISALRVHAESANRELNNLAEAQNLNQHLNTVDAAFHSPEYQGEEGFENRIRSLDDGDWLKQHNITAPDGSPDRVMAEKLIADTERQRAQFKQVQEDHDNKGLEQYSPLIYENKLSLPQIEHLQGQLSPRAVANLKTQLYQKQAMDREEWRQDRSIKRAERQDQKQEIAQQKQDREEASGNRRAQISMDIANGKVYEPLDIRTMDDLTDKDKAQLVEDVKSGGVLQNPYVKDALTKIAQLPLQPSDQGELARIFMEQTKGGDLRGGAITQNADQLIDRAKKRDASEWIQQTFSHLSTSGQITPRDRSVLSRSGVQGPPAGFDVKVKAKDGKWYWGNSTTHEIGGEAQ